MGKLSKPVKAFLERLYRDPRYLLIGKRSRLGKERVVFLEVNALLSPTGDAKGQVLVSQEYQAEERPDGERPYGFPSLLEYYHSRLAEESSLTLEAEECAALREESWHYYVRRNFAFQSGEYGRAREDAEHNQGLADIVAAHTSEPTERWAFLRWWPWMERDRAVAQALLNLQAGEIEAAAAELYRAGKAINNFAHQHASEYAAEGEEGRNLPEVMKQHLAALEELLRREHNLPVSLEEQLDKALERGDREEAERLRQEMIRELMAE